MPAVDKLNLCRRKGVSVMRPLASSTVAACSCWQVTNQMVKACKGYLTEEGSARVWDQDRVMIIGRIHDCLNLNRAYQDAFQRTKKRMEETPGEKPFDFSQLYIFGKFEAFCRRLEKVRPLLELCCRSFRR